MDKFKQYLTQTKILLQKVGQILLRWLKTVAQYSHSWILANWPHIKDRLQQYIVLTRLDRPIGTYLVLWPTLWALWIAAEGIPTLHLFTVFVLGTLLMRSAGCVANDYADRNFDGHVERTKDRPLATGKVSNKEALLLAITMVLVAFLLVLTTNQLTIILSFFAIPIAIIYPYMKRHTYLPQFFLGIAFSWGIPMAFAAQTGGIPNIVWLIFIANLLWAVVFDTIYAMVDREHDLKIGIKSTAILFDDADKTIIGIMQAMVLIVLLIVAKQLELNWPFYISLIVAAGFSIYQQYLIKDRVPAKCFQAFLNNKWFGMTVFIGIVVSYAV
jgi:4-hydroxybenzoate polyprenyltransferase